LMVCPSPPSLPTHTHTHTHHTQRTTHAQMKTHHHIFSIASSCLLGFHLDCSPPPTSLHVKTTIVKHTVFDCCVLPQAFLCLCGV
jgi:hypothetical protein